LIQVIIRIKDVNLVGLSISLFVLEIKLDRLLRADLPQNAIADKANNEEA
jgi:hypothetical protein